jgi:hypothetical protein
MITIFNFLEKTTTTKSGKFFYVLFAPIFLILEFVCYWWYWKRIIIPEILTADEIVEFLDKNEFGYTGGKIWKSDLIESNEFFDRLSLEDSKHVIKKEYIEILSTIFKDNLSLNVEDYITLIVLTEMKLIKYQGELLRNKVYTVIIQFCRYYYLQKIFRQTIVWFIITGLLVTGYFLILRDLLV